MDAHLIPRWAEGKRSLPEPRCHNFTPKCYLPVTIPPQCKSTSGKYRKGEVMKKAAIAMITASLIATPVQAAEWGDARTGTFVGARLTIGGRTGPRPQAALMLAPTQSRISNGGMVRTTIGEGLALNFSPKSKPTLTLAGIRADRVLSLAATDDGDKKRGISTGVWVAIGVVAAVGVSALLYADYCNDNEATLCGDEE